MSLSAQPRKGTLTECGKLHPPVLAAGNDSQVNDVSAINERCEVLGVTTRGVECVIA